MAEVEIHAGHEHEIDPFGRAVGVAVGLLGIVLAVATIGAHRAHTAAVISRTEANDQWAFFQAKKGRQHLLEIGGQLADALGSDAARVRVLSEKFRADHERYVHEADEIQQEARARDAESRHQEQRALRLDLAEGFLELGLVLSSLYFLARRRFFPAFGAVAGAFGVLLTVWGLLT
jgi:hypothetical protein